MVEKYKSYDSNNKKWEIRNNIQCIRYSCKNNNKHIRCHSTFFSFIYDFHSSLKNKNKKRCHKTDGIIAAIWVGYPLATKRKGHSEPITFKFFKVSLKFSLWGEHWYYAIWVPWNAKKNTCWHGFCVKLFTTNWIPLILIWTFSCSSEFIWSTRGQDAYAKRDLWNYSKE